MVAVLSRQVHYLGMILLLGSLTVALATMMHHGLPRLQLQILRVTQCELQW